MGILSAEQLEAIGFQSIGSNVRISDKASIYGASRISIGDNVRIDDFCVISAGDGGIRIGSHIHIAVYSSIIGAGTITLGDFCNISSRVSIYSSSDDYSGQYMTSPVVGEPFTGVDNSPVRLEKHVIVGSGSVILPGAELEQGVAIGAFSLVNSRYEEFGIYAGVPARRIKERARDFLQMEPKFLEKYRGRE
jgi:galactoside O-acetyltransferase